MVLVSSDDAHRHRWPLGIVESTHLSDDGLVRSATIRTTGGVILRDVRKICLLEAAEEDKLCGSTPSTDSVRNIRRDSIAPG